MTDRTAVPRPPDVAIQPEANKVRTDLLTALKRHPQGLNFQGLCRAIPDSGPRAILMRTILQDLIEQRIVEVSAGKYHLAE